MVQMSFALANLIFLMLMQHNCVFLFGWLKLQDMGKDLPFWQLKVKCTLSYFKSHDKLFKLITYKSRAGSIQNHQLWSITYITINHKNCNYMINYLHYIQWKKIATTWSVTCMSITVNQKIETKLKVKTQYSIFSEVSCPKAGECKWCKDINYDSKYGSHIKAEGIFILQYYVNCLHG
jgi:hypothetical protein